MRTIASRKTLLALLYVTALMPAVATAQTTNKAFVRDLFFRDVVDPQEDRTYVNQIAASSADAIANFVVLALSSAPVASSSAGFSYVRDATTGELSLKSDSFGPTFAERPLTNGAGVWNVGVNFQYSSIAFNGDYGTADGTTEGLPIFDNTARHGSNRYLQFLTERSYLQSRTEALHFALSYGATDRLDIGVLVPIVWLKLTGRNDLSWDFTGQCNAGNCPTATATGTGVWKPTQTQSTSGIGDVAVRLKYSLSAQRDEGVALAADLRLPTGDEENFLGTGKASLKMLLVLSKSDLGPASIHANAGYTAGGLSDELNYVVGTDAALLSKKQLTASVSLLGRTLRDGALPTRVQTVKKDGDGTPNLSEIVVDRFIWSKASVSLLQVAAGMKFHVGGQWLLDASVLLPLNEHGFQPKVSPWVGLEHTWGQ